MVLANPLAVATPAVATPMGISPERFNQLLKENEELKKKEEDRKKKDEEKNEKKEKYQRQLYKEGGNILTLFVVVMFDICLLFGLVCGNR